MPDMAGPYEHTGCYQSAADELADALQGQAPHLSKVVAAQLGEYMTVELAQAIRRAVHVGRQSDSLAHERFGVVSRLD